MFWGSINPHREVVIMQSTCDKRYRRKPKILWEFKERTINSCQGRRERIIEEVELE